MSIYKRAGKNRWWFSIYRGPDKPRLCGSTGKTDRAEAEAVEHLLRMAYAGKTPKDRLQRIFDGLMGTAPSGLPLQGVWGVYEGWVVSAGRKLSGSFLGRKRCDCLRFVAWAAEHWPAAVCAGSVDRSCAAAFGAWLVGEGLSGKSRRNIVGNLGSIWEGLRRVRDDVTQNPWPLVLSADDSKRGQAFNREQEVAIIKAADTIGKGWGLACRIARYTGLRYGDVARLMWADVDLDAGVIRTVPSKTKRHEVGVLIPLCAPLALAFAEARRTAPFAEFVLSGHAKAYPNPYKGEPGAFALVLKAAEVTGDYTFHSWRHTFRTRLAEAGVSDELAKRLGGWTVDKTAMRYDHDGRIAELRAAVEQGAQASG